jgi:hypothetical protein
MPIKINGATSGYVQLSAPDVAGNTDLTLPSGTGTLLTAEGGKVLQVVRATDVTNRVTTSTTFVDASISVTITPQKNDSTIMLIWSIMTNFPSSNKAELQITDSGNTAISGAEAMRFGSSNVTSPEYPAVLIAYATPATTSATTYKARFRVLGGTGTIANASTTGQLYAIEVSA